MRPGTGKARILNKLSLFSGKLLHRNSQDDAYSISFVVAGVTTGILLEAGIGSDAGIVSGSGIAGNNRVFKSITKNTHDMNVTNISNICLISVVFKFFIKCPALKLNRSVLSCFKRTLMPLLTC